MDKANRWGIILALDRKKWGIILTLDSTKMGNNIGPGLGNNYDPE